ncbi:MAG: DUF1456 family protein [Balneolaceae bacterium]|nr:DUF1456 family protein [Balneolaceae bacterium]
MRNDDIIQSIRYMLDIDDVKIAHILKLRGYQPEREEIIHIFDDSNPDDDQNNTDTSHELLAYFLDGLIYHLRGKSDKHPPRPIKTPVTNNMVLKKLRVAFKLQEDDMHEITGCSRFFPVEAGDECSFSERRFQRTTANAATMIDPQTSKRVNRQSKKRKHRQLLKQIYTPRPPPGGHPS